MGPRWKGKGFIDIADANPMSQIVRQLQSSLARSEAHAMLSGCNVLLEAEPLLADFLDRTCFGRQISTSDKDKQWFQLGMEEAFYMSHALQCLVILGGNGKPMSEMELWEYMKSKREAFPEFYKAYAHLRAKNWVVRSGTQYGVDFVAYRHHPALVHSEYGVLVLSEGNAGSNGARLRVWSDLQCSLRVCGSVAKTLLVLCIRGAGGDASSPSCLEQYIVEERTIARWVPEQCREDYEWGKGQMD